MKSKKSLLINGQADRQWSDILSRIIVELNFEINISDYSDNKKIIWEEYELIVLDASIFGDLVEIISQIRSKNNRACVIVFSSAPDWKQAREVLLAGAADYSRKTEEVKYLSSTIERNLINWELALLNKQEVIQD